MKCLRSIAFVYGILLSACTDNAGFIELKGKLLEDDTKVGIPRRNIIVQALIKDDIKFIPGYAGEFFTDSSGCFTYTLKKVKNVYLYDFCIVGDSVYACSNVKLGLTELNRDAKILTFYLNRLADLTIKTERKNKSKASAFETLYLEWESNGIIGEMLYPYKIENYGINFDKRLIWIGDDVRFVIRTKVYADKRTIVRWKLFSNGEYKEITDTIYCKRDASNSVNLVY
jgi:hypothetical protein